MRTYLNVPFAEKDTAKRMGARWDQGVRKWYVEDVEDIGKFLRWMPEHLLRPATVFGQAQSGLPLAGPQATREGRRKTAKVPRKRDHRRADVQRKPDANSAGVVVGAHYYDCQCHCDIPPWEVCEHSFPHVLEAEYAAMQAVADAMRAVTH